MDVKVPVIMSIQKSGTYMDAMVPNIGFLHQLGNKAGYLWLDVFFVQVEANNSLYATVSVIGIFLA